MILLFQSQIAIMTPPKCATNTLHAALCQPPHHGAALIGPAEPSTNSRHCRVWPAEADPCRKYVVVRNPADRLVSLYLHYARQQSGLGRAVECFAEFAARVGSGNEPAPLYGWNLSTWLEGVPFDGVLRVESLLSDLQATGLAVDRLPLLNRSFRHQDYAAFYTPEILTTVERWARPDIERFGYN
jgi:hypothetical protein